MEVEVNQNDLLPQELLDEALEEFIESQKIRDRKLYKDFSDNPPELIPMLKPKHAIVEEETEAEKEEMRKKSLAVNAILEKEMEERPLESESEDEESDKDDKWDCQSILSTLTNKDNHPGVIKTNRVVKLQKHKLEMHK